MEETLATIRLLVDSGGSVSVLAAPGLVGLVCVTLINPSLLGGPWKVAEHGILGIFTVTPTWTSLPGVTPEAVGYGRERPHPELSSTVAGQPAIVQFRNNRLLIQPVSGGSGRPMPTLIVPAAVKAFTGPASTQLRIFPLEVTAMKEPLFSPVMGWGKEGKGIPGMVTS
ncbi:hypothetical protein [Actinomadura chokoriensis]|uniref:Uncharacterized protein n=1 Tax=Actinomadura chokoriensis TaxID=454156 RepID=A0ABV4R7Z3_9ACTN